MRQAVTHQRGAISGQLHYAPAHKEPEEKPERIFDVLDAKGVLADGKHRTMTALSEGTDPKPPSEARSQVGAPAPLSHKSFIARRSVFPDFQRLYAPQEPSGAAFSASFPLGPERLAQRVQTKGS